MAIEGGQNTDGRGIGDSIHAPDTSAPECGPREQRRVRLSFLPPSKWPSTVPGTDSGTFTPVIPKQRHTNEVWNLVQQTATTITNKRKEPPPKQQHLRNKTHLDPRPPPPRPPPTLLPPPAYHRTSSMHSLPMPQCSASWPTWKIGLSPGSERWKTAS